MSDRQKDDLVKNESELYKLAWEELEDNRVNKAIWAMAYAESDGDEAKTRAAYLRERVQFLKQEQQDKIHEVEEEQPVAPIPVEEVQQPATQVSSVESGKESSMQSVSPQQASIKDIKSEKNKFSYCKELIGSLSRLEKATTEQWLRLDKPIQGAVVALMVMNVAFDYLKKVSNAFNKILTDAKALLTENADIQEVGLLNLGPPDRNTDINDLPLVSSQFKEAITRITQLKKLMVKQYEKEACFVGEIPSKQAVKNEPLNRKKELDGDVDKKESVLTERGKQDKIHEVKEEQQPTIQASLVENEKEPDIQPAPPQRASVHVAESEKEMMKSMAIFLPYIILLAGVLILLTIYIISGY